MSEIINKNVLLQYSGGKDSTACLIYMLENKIKFDAIHFVHDYSYDLPTTQAQSICNQFNVKLHVINITKELEDLFLNNFRLRPCRFCKSIMDKITVDFAKNNNFNLICVGDTGSDTMLVNRIKETNKTGLIVSKYFNKSITLPKDISIYRPLIYMDNEQVLNTVYSKLPNFKRMNDTGDKYFEYSREGCPLQFKDFGIPYTKKLMQDLLWLNKLCSQFATERKIKASIHLPSEFILTIPAGYENECRQYLMDNGYVFRKNENSTMGNIYSYQLSVEIYDELKDKSILEEALSRFIERIELSKSDFLYVADTFIMQNNSYKFIASIIDNYLIISLFSKKSIEEKKLQNILVEIFHTYNFKLNIEKL